MREFYDTMSQHWPGAEAVCRTSMRCLHLTYELTIRNIQPSYMSTNNPYCTTTFPTSTSILTPISLPDSSFANTSTSPVLSHHSQEYQHSLHDPVHQHHGLGITAAFPGDYPRTVTAGLGYPSEDMGIGPGDTGFSPLPPPAKRPRRAHRHPPTRDTPVNILPNPEGLQRLEQERQRRGQAETQIHQRPRAPGRGRKDPKAEEEDAYVEQLREQNLAWRVVREMFRERFQKDASEARLQMRLLRRRKERLAQWDENDVSMCGHYPLP